MDETTETEIDFESGDFFATAPKDISHVTFYFDRTPEDYEDSRYFFAKVETGDHVNDDLDTWYQQAIDAMALQNPNIGEYRFLGAAIKYGSGKNGNGGEFYYAADGSDCQPDESPLGYLVQNKDARSFFQTYDYDQLF